MLDYLLFRKMIAPVIMQVLFWGAIGATVYYSVWLIREGNWAGWMALIFGTLLTRVLFELAFVSFRILDTLRSIDISVAGQARD